MEGIKVESFKEANVFAIMQIQTVLEYSAS